jgi:hypothetical protein
LLRTPARFSWNGFRWQKRTATFGEPAMIPNALLITVAVLLALGFWLLGELKFFSPYKAVLFQAYAMPILVYVSALFANVFAAAFVLIRKFFLKDTGRKLLHLDKQLQVGETSIPAPWLEQESN